ncbi:CGNR zinc finger domain-containing protein [Dactylosporangium sp. CA-092794]|uniref:CGNR zinc finger domain-containing protein n=1 Tax=Dactylosporangium sp. CA-092794 TaxID=3239929 RepID=UPI003D926056
MTFVFVSGDLALDFAATLKWRRSGTPEELLSTSDDVARWAVEAGVLSRPPRVGETELRDLLALREAVYRLLRGDFIGSATASARRPADVRLVNRAAARPGPRVQLTADGVRRTGDAAALATAVATAAIGLLESRPTVRECAGDACTRLFVDRSRAGNRTWCGMEECGNRVKAASYRARRSAS